MKNEHKIYLLTIARKSIADNLGIKWNGYKKNNELLVIKIPKAEVHEVKGTFVTLTIEGNLRGCIGQIIPDDPIDVTIRDNAISAAIHDPRFPALTVDEFYRTEIEISILSKPIQLKYRGSDDLLGKIEQGKHGVIIRSEGHSATFLPQVWEEIGTKKEFLTHLCMKARLFPDEWRSGKLEVFVYSVEHFDEKELDLDI
ncbi:MAG: AmmeMemoRadiSam system protein A [Proteobacteria bacterium]|nr:AmmeMemoRadiSam system protein A [Pseudomonadota bacterium]